MSLISFLLNTQYSIFSRFFDSIDNDCVFYCFHIIPNTHNSTISNIGSIFIFIKLSWHLYTASDIMTISIVFPNTTMPIAIGLNNMTHYSVRAIGVKNFCALHNLSIFRIKTYGCYSAATLTLFFRRFLSYDFIRVPFSPPSYFFPVSTSCSLLCQVYFIFTDEVKPLRRRRRPSFPPQSL